MDTEPVVAVEAPTRLDDADDDDQLSSVDATLICSLDFMEDA